MQRKEQATSSADGTGPTRGDRVSTAEARRTQRRSQSFKSTPMPGETKPHRKPAAQGDQVAFENLIRGVSEDLHAAGIKDTLVSDVIAELWIAIKEGRYDPNRSARAFAHGIARNKKLRENRDKNKQQSLSRLSGEDEDAFKLKAVTESHPAKRRLDPDLKIARREMSQTVVDALEEVIEKHVADHLKEHARLKYMMGIPTRETAVRLGIDYAKLTEMDRELGRLIRRRLKEILAPRLTLTVTRLFKGNS